MANQIVNIRKYNGTLEPFSSKKLLHSLSKAGADRKTAQNIVTRIAEQLYDGVTTKEIYDEAFGILNATNNSKAARYNLKRAIMELGPSGFPFESFIASLFNHQGFTTQVGVKVDGKCVTHDVDVVAEKDNKHYMVECKYHNSLGKVSDVKIALYVHARFLDIEAQWKKIDGHALKFHQGWLVTNTRLTSDALQYGACAGLLMLSWDYPKDNGIKDLMDKSGLYPITCLTKLTKREKELLLNARVVLCRDLCDQPERLHEIGIHENRVTGILDEGNALCKSRRKRISSVVH